MTNKSIAPGIAAILGKVPPGDRSVVREALGLMTAGEVAVTEANIRKGRLQPSQLASFFSDRVYSLLDVYKERLIATGTFTEYCADEGHLLEAIREGVRAMFDRYGSSEATAAKLVAIVDEERSV